MSAMLPQKIKEFDSRHSVRSRGLARGDALIRVELQNGLFARGPKQFGLQRLSDYTIREFEIEFDLHAFIVLLNKTNLLRSTVY
jgi:hypothetical protein